MKQLADPFVRSAFIRARQLPKEPRLRQAPVPPHRAHRHIEHVRRLLEAQPAEEPQLDDAALPRVQRLERLQRIVERDEIDAGGRRGRSAASDSETCSWPPPALRAIARPGDVDEDAAHDLRRDAEEVRPVLPAHVLPVDQPQVGLVDERRRPAGCARDAPRP